MQIDEQIRNTLDISVEGYAVAQCIIPLLDKCTALSDDPDPSILKLAAKEISTIFPMIRTNVYERALILS